MAIDLKSKWLMIVLFANREMELLLYSHDFIGVVEGEVVN